MKTAAGIIRREIKNQRCRFVFPSETAASLWAGKSCEFTGVESVALNRFLAWDRFKETAIRAESGDTRGRRPVSAVLRKLFTGALVRKNAGAAFFRALIPPEFAEEGQIFTPGIAGLLPSLALLRSRQGTEPRDDEDRDFVLLEREYAAFLERRGLFEPAWEKPPLGDREHEYYIFFPEAMEDWEEYRDLLEGEASVHVIHCMDGEPEEGLELGLCHSSRTEIRGAALEIRRLHGEEGVAYEDMALSVPDLAGMEPYILRDFGLYDIPVRRRAGKPLAEYGAGRLFALIGGCVTNHFSFASLKSLLLDDQIPWRRPDLNRKLIEFGAANNCVSGYWDRPPGTSGGGSRRFVDVWSEALGRDGREEQLRNYYGELKERLRALVEAESFAGVRRFWFAFRGRLWEEAADPGLSGGAGTPERLRAAYPEAVHPGSVFRGFLSREACTGEGDAVLARCVEELSILVHLEEEYPELIPPSPFNFFLNELREKQYVPVRSGPGVNLFPYRVAAGAPFAAHFILGASQQDATVLYRPLNFLRQDKRERLGLSDRDASAAFFRLHRPGSFETAGGCFTCHTRISAAERTFSGWVIPHSLFAGKTRPLAPPRGDPYQEERDWWAGNTPEFPRRIFRAQKQGFENWRQVLGLRSGGRWGRYSFIREALAPPGPVRELLEKRIGEVQRVEQGETLLKVSATDLNSFFTCPLSWLWEKVFGLEEQVLEARLLDDASLGNLYHEILRNLFARIREEDRSFDPRRLDLYGQWAESRAMEAAEHYPAFQGPLAVPLLVSMAKTIAKKVRALLDLEARYFPGYTVAELEYPLELRRGGLLFKGRLDRVSVSPEGEPFILDYKTGVPPTRAASTVAEDGSLRDFQMPMYLKLYEESAGTRAGGALFISINGRDLGAVVGKPGAKRGHDREEYQPTLDALEGYIEDFAARVRALDFVPREIPFETCAGCAYRGLCRTTYSLKEEP